MSLVLYYHPLASFCHKVLLALYENGTPFEGRIVDLTDPAQKAELTAVWPVGKFPVLRDDARGRSLPETSIIIEYLDRHYPGPVPLLPEDPEQALDARLWDRFFDLYVSVPMQKIVGDRLRPEDRRDPYGVEEAFGNLEMAYDMLEDRMKARTFAAGDDFGIADCSAAPALFYTDTLRPFGERPNLRAYMDRLESRPSFKRVIREARPYFKYYPFQERIPERFLADAPEA